MEMVWEMLHALPSMPIKPLRRSKKLNGNGVEDMLGNHGEAKEEEAVAAAVHGKPKAKVRHSQYL